MKPIGKGRILAGLVAAAAVTAFAYPRLVPYAPGPWLEDFAQMREETHRGYANLDWAVARHGLDLGGLEAQATDAIRGARTPGEARQALQAYAAAFGDGHYRLDVPGPRVFGWLSGNTGSDAPVLDPGMDGARACRVLGFENRDLGFRLGFDDLDGYRALPRTDNPFEAGVLSLDDGRRFGVLRLAHFGEDGYRDSCARAWTAFRATLDAPCDGDCQSRFRSAVSDRMLDELAQRVAELGRAAPDGLVVDVTGNGGGTNWADAAARTLTPVPLHGARQAFVRDPHWTGRFEPMLAAIERDLDRDDLTTAQRALLGAAAGRVHALAALAARPCGDAAATSPPGQRDCPNLVQGDYFATGLLAYAPRAELEGLESARLLFGPSAYAYAEGAYRGPLVVLHDGGTASAAEYFAATLADNDAATLVGARTAGVGCGYTRGGRNVVLANSGIRVRMPDCMRLRPDGRNEADGVAPDIDAGWAAGDSDSERAAKIVAALERLPTRS